MKKERWLPVVGFEGRYEVSDHGRVRSFQRGAKGRLLRPGKMGSGHLSVALGRGNSRTVHSLVMLAFIGMPPAGNEVRHLNGKPADNRLSNLKYGTRAENTQDKKYHRGARSYRLKPQDVLRIRRRLGPFGAGARLAREYNVAQSTISAIKHARFHRDLM